MRTRSASSSSPDLANNDRIKTRTRTTTIWQRLAIGAVLLIAASMLYGADKFSLPPDSGTFKPGPGAEIAVAQCLLCHWSDYVSTQPRLPRTTWRATVLKMRDKYGAPLPEDKVEILAEYLSKTYGAEATK